MPKHFILPFGDESLFEAKAGEIILISGDIYTARDQAHARMRECILSGRPLPFDLTTNAVYYAGPTPKRDNEIIGSCGPTTSARMDALTPIMIENGLRVMIGKGKRSQEVIEYIKKRRAVYLCAAGGAAALIKNYVKACELIAYEDLGCEAVYKLSVESFEVIVGIDSLGNSIF